MSAPTGVLAQRAGQELRALLEQGAEALGHRPRGHRGWMAMVKAAVFGYYTEIHPHPDVIVAAERWLGELESLQAPNGLFASGDNLVSPPDSAFTINDAALTASFLRRYPGAADQLRRRLDQVIGRSLPALTSGGVHTPNHRWEISSALVAAGEIHGGALAGPATLRALDWLGEGVDVDSDGLYSERSANYAANVSNPALLTLSQYLDRPELLRIVHLNVHAHLDLTSPDGGVETIHSRRQDQFGGPFPLGPFATQFAVFADHCARCRNGLRRALVAPGLDPVDVLIRSMLDDRVAAGLAAAHRDPEEPEPEQRVDRWFAGTRLWRHSDGQNWISLYGGSDVPAEGRIGSGLATNPTFLRAGLGAVELSSMRLSRDFFSMGPFRAGSMVRQAGRLFLQEQIGASYYQPLPARSRDAAGQYRLEHEGRFTAAMAFAERAAEEVDLTTTITFDPGPHGSAMLSIDTRGAVSGHALEIALPEGTSVDGATDLGAGRFGITGATTIRRGGDTVVLEPDAASAADVAPFYEPGEAFTFLGGTDAVHGTRLYLTWRSPAAVRLGIRRCPPMSSEAR